MKISATVLFAICVASFLSWVDYLPSVCAKYVSATNWPFEERNFETGGTYVPEFASVLNQSQNVVENPLLIGSFNIQTLGKKKFATFDVMSIIEKVILRYDLILIMEIITGQDDLLNKLITTINRLSADGIFYNMTVSTKHPITNEHCGFIYRTDKVDVVRSEMFTDMGETFYRKPFIVQFKALTLRDMTEFVTIGLHVKPSQAVQEMNALAEVYDFVKDTYRITDVMLMGDFNADCDYVKEGDWDRIALWTREEFTWPIKHEMDTTTNHKSCALDRFVFAGSNMDKGVIMSSARVFNFQEAYGLTISETRKISDHWPIEIQIRGKMSFLAEKYLITLVCVTMTDSRPMPTLDENDVSKKAKSIGYSFTKIAQQMKLSNNSNTKSSVVDSLRKLRNTVPEVITNEQLQGIVYKLKHDSLSDSSSYADIPRPAFYTRVTINENISTVTVCRRTTVN